jgi:hypothetical protein
MITDTTVWRPAAERYTTYGGDLQLARQADEMRQLFATVDADQQKDIGYAAEDWKTRAGIAAFLQNVREEQYEQAEQALIHLAKEPGAPSVKSRIIENYATRLLQEHPQSAEIGQRVTTAMGRAMSQLLNLFISYGATDLAPANWEIVQGTASSKYLYMTFYARAVLAEAGLQL